MIFSAMPVTTRATRSLIGVVCCVLVVTSCSATVLEGRASSMLFNPERVGGLPVRQGPSGPKPNAPAPVGSVINSDGGPIDQLTLLGVNDIQDYWAKHYADYLPGNFQPVATLFSYDSTDPSSPPVCGSQTYDRPNAMFCFTDNLMAWDRGVMMPVASRYFGDMGLVGIIAHEYGHALQWMSGLANSDTNGLVREQQADCFAGAYLWSVAAGESPRFTLSTGDGLNKVLAGAIFLRDQLGTKSTEDPHGSALDRVSAFQMGFSGGADQCAGIDSDEIKKRQGDLPQALTYDASGAPIVDSPINKDLLTQLMDVLGKVLAPSQPPSLSMQPAECADAATTDPVSYCPATNTINVDMARLKAVGTPKSETEDAVLLQGDNTALSMFTSRYALALQHERGVALDNPVAALRTACLTGVAQGRMANPDSELVLSPGDTDEAVSGLLTNGLVASDVNGATVPAGFSRILAYRLGLSSAVDECFERFT
jgi:predicted metalloprotease